MLLFIGGIEIMVIILFVIIFFGADKIPELARGMGKMIRQVRDASDDIKREIRDESNQIKKDLDYYFLYDNFFNFSN